MLGLAVSAILLSLIFNISPDRQHIFLRGFPDCVMPGTCPSRQLFHSDCPGCGLTRSIVFLAHNDWRSSWQMHRVGWLIALTIILQVPYRILCLRRGRLVLGRTLPKAFGLMLIVLLIGNWVMGLLL